MAQSKFKGQPQDYLDWFKVGYTEENKVYLPACAPDQKVIMDVAPVVPSYRKYGNGKSYVRQHIQEHNESCKKSLEEDGSLYNADRSGGQGALDCISTIVDTEYGDEEMTITPNELVQVYLHYDFSKYSSDSQRLPVYNCKKEILQKIEEYPVVIVQGETGCGKSTQVPQYILDDGAEKNKHVNIIVTQPRKIAATSLANRVCQERGWKMGSLVAYQIGLDNQCDQDTRLSYVTTEVFVQKIINKRSLNEYTHIVLDEVHERDEHTDFALLLVKKLLHTVSKDIKIILMSATIECEKFAKYFATPVRDHLIPAPIVSITDRYVHKVHKFYLDNLKIAYPDQQIPPYELDRPKIGPEMLQLSINLIHLFDDLERSEEQIQHPHFPNCRGAVLMFVPGLHEIESVIELLKKEANKKKWETYPLHSSITLDEQKAAFRPADSQVRKIIVSTNIAESSVTLPDIKYIIDFCLTKVITCDPVTNYTSLKMAWASKSSCQQRAGRVGRVSSGRVYRLVEEQFYDELEAHPTPEICRSPLGSVVLKIKQLNMGAPKALLALALDPPNLTDINRTILVLKQIGCLNLKSGGHVSAVDGDLTNLGRVAASLPLDPKLSKFIMMGFLFGCLEETVIIAAGISLKSFHSTPFQDELNAFLSKVSWAHGSFSDCLAILSTYKSWEYQVMSGEFARSNSSEKKWARESYVQLESLKQVHKLVLELNKRLNRLKMIRHLHPNANAFEWNEARAFFLKICMAGAFYPNYFKKSVVADCEKKICRELSGHDPFSTLIVGGLPVDTSVLYDSQLRDIFKDCSKDLTISFEGSKAFIQFPKRKRCLEMEEKSIRDIPGDCPTSMHLALKMKQIHRIRNTLKLNLINPIEAKERLNTLSALNEKGELCGTSCNTNNPHTVELLPPCLPHPSVHMLKVRVTFVESPSRLWVIADGPDYIEKESYIESVISMTLGTDSQSLATSRFSKVVPKTICLAPYVENADAEEMYFRARVEEVNEAKNKALVYFVDFGNSEVVDIRKLKEMPATLLAIPMLAIECALSEVKPSSLRLQAEKMEGQMWSQDSIVWLNNAILDKEFMAQIYSVVHNVMNFELYEITPLDYGPGGRKKSINKLLIERRFAVKSEEFYLSKQNHELRAVVGSNFSNQSTLKSLTSSLSACSVSNFNVDTRSLSSSSTKMVPIYLRGPSSPIEMNFMALSRTGGPKGVKLDRTSVNSTALDLEPQNPYDRLIVSPFVALTASESNAVLHHSTLMPVLPGILALSLLMFCPYAELRVNEGGSEYIGALFGLGYDPETGGAIYPDDDMEVAFDFNFSDEDLNKINDLRYLMSSTLDSYDEIRETDLKGSQAYMTDTVMNLLNENRTYKKPVYYHRSYRWNEVAEGDLHKATTVDSEGDETFIWQSILGIKLHPVDMEKAIVQKTKHLKRLKATLKAEKQMDSYVVDEECLLCCKVLKTFHDLQIHLSTKSHSIKEHKLYGFC